MNAQAQRQYIVQHEAWYAGANGLVLPSVSFGLYIPGDGTAGEMLVEWVNLGGRLVPQLECFDDGWAALFSFGDVLEGMAAVDDLGVDCKEFVRLLDRCGFTDMTPRVHPAPEIDTNVGANDPATVTIEITDGVATVTDAPEWIGRGWCSGKGPWRQVDTDAAEVAVITERFGDV